jgi:hypothetical protein
MEYGGGGRYGNPVIQLDRSSIFINHVVIKYGLSMGIRVQQRPEIPLRIYFLTVEECGNVGLYFLNNYEVHIVGAQIRNNKECGIRFATDNSNINVKDSLIIGNELDGIVFPRGNITVTGTEIHNHFNNGIRTEYVNTWIDIRDSTISQTGKWAAHFTQPTNVIVNNTIFENNSKIF